MPKTADPRAPPATTTTAVVVFDPEQPRFIYEAVDPDTGTVFYVGRTNDIVRRSDEHDKSKYKIREILKLKNYKFKDIVRPVPELPRGCHHDDAAELEAYFIFNRKCIYDPVTNPMGCNSRLGDRATKMTPERYAEITKMLEAGYQWPEEKAALPEAVPDELATARGVECVIDELLVYARADGDTEAVKVLEEQYTLAKKETLVFERNWYGVRGLAEFVLKNYKHTYVDAVNLHTLKLELDAIKDTLKGDPEYEDLAGVITALGLVAHPDKARTVSSTAAACFLEGVIAMIATREEEKLTWTKTCGNGRHPPYGVRDHIYKVRQWTRANGMEKPSHHAADATERSLGKFLNKWKIPSAEYYGGACTDLKSCDVVMRDVPWWPAFVGFGERNKNDWKKLNAQLLEGYAYKDEPPFEGQKPISGARGNRSVYVKLHDFVNYGRSAEADVETALSGLPEVRANWYRAQYTKARRLGKHKRKLDDDGSTSTDPLPDDPSGDVPMDDAAVEDDAEDGDDGSDDDE